MDDYSDRVFKGLEPQNVDDKRVQYLQEAFALPLEQQTYSNILALAKAHGASPADKAADDFFKKQKESFAHIKQTREQRLQNQQEQTLNQLTTGSTSMQLPPDFQAPDLSSDLGPVNQNPPMLGRYNLSTPSPPPQFADISGLGPNADSAQTDAYIQSLSPENVDTLLGKLLPQGPRSLDLNTNANGVKGLVQTSIPPPLTKLGIPETLLPIIKAEFLSKGTSPTFDKIITQKTSGTPKTEAEFALAAAGGDPQKALDILQSRKEKDFQGNDLMTFEATNPEGMTAHDRGTLPYTKAFNDWRKRMYGNQRVLGKTEGGDLIAFNSRGGLEIGGVPAKDYTGPILSTTNPTPSEAALKEIAAFNISLSTVEDIRTSFKKNPDAVGPINGRWNSIKKAFVDNQDFQILFMQVDSLIIQAYGLSGAQIGPQEMNILRNFIMPSVNNPKGNFIVALNQAEKFILKERNARVKALENARYYLGPNDRPSQNYTISPNQLLEELKKQKDFLQKKKVK